MADVQLTASIDAAGFNRGINEMKHSLKDLQDTGNMTYDRLDSGFNGVENRLTSTGASVRRLEAAFSRYASAMSQDLQMVAGASTQVGQKVDAASQKMAQDMRNLVQAVNQLHAAFTTLLQPVRNIDSQSAQTVTQLRNIVNEMRTLNSAVQQTNAQLQNMTSSTTSNTQANNANAASFDKQQSSIRSVKDIMQAVLALGFGSQFAKEVAEATGYMVQLEASFRVLLGSATEARNMMGDLVTFAMRTPFDLKGTADAAKQLLAYGIAAEDVIETERRLGDIGAALGLTMRDLAYLYGTTKTQGRLYALDMRQFTTRGIPMLETLSKQLNVTTADITKMVTAGQIGFKEVKNAIWAMTDEGGQFGGLMEEQFNTIKGQLSNLGDAWYQFLAALGKSADIEFGLTGGLEDFNDNLMQLAANADIIIGSLEVLAKSLLAIGAVQGGAWLVKTIASMFAFDAAIKTTTVSMAGYNVQAATGTTIGSNLIASWRTAILALRSYSAHVQATGSSLAAASVAASAFGTAVSATMPYIGMALAIYGIVSACVAWNKETDVNEQSLDSLSKAATSADIAIAKLYTNLTATSEGTEAHSRAIEKLIGKLVENNVVSKEYCDSLETEAEKTQLLINKKEELAAIERNSQIRSSADTQRESILSTSQDNYTKAIKTQLDHVRHAPTNDAPDLSEYAVYEFDIDDYIESDKLEAFYSQAANMLGYIRNQLALTESQLASGALSQEEYARKTAELGAQASRAIKSLSDNYTENTEGAEQVRIALQKVFDAATKMKSEDWKTSWKNMNPGADLTENFDALVASLTNLEALTQEMTGSYSNPASEYTDIYNKFSMLEAYLNKDTVPSIFSMLNDEQAAYTLMSNIDALQSKIAELTSDPKLIKLDIEKGAPETLKQLHDYGIQQIEDLITYAREHPTEFTANIDEIEANMRSVEKKMKEDPDWQKHTTQFTGELTALNEALNTGAEDIERFKKNHGRLDIDFGVILRNNSLELVTGFLKKIRDAFDSLGLDSLVARIDAAIASISQRSAAYSEKQQQSHTTPADRLTATRASYKNSGNRPDLNTYNEYTTQELENRVKDIKQKLKDQRDDARGRAASADLNEELAAIQAELTQRSPSKSQAAADKQRKAAELARREADRKKKEEDKRRKAAEALDKLMRKHELALDEASDANLLNEYQRRLEELENQLNKKNNSIQDELISAENKAKEAGTINGKEPEQNEFDIEGKKVKSYLSKEQYMVFYNESIEAQKKYNREVHNLEIEHNNDRLEFIEKYGSLLEQKLAYVEDYNNKIKKAVEEGNIYEAESLQLELDAKIQNLNMDKFRKSIDWETVFDNLDRVSTQALQDLQNKLQTQLETPNIDPENAKVLSEKILEIENKLAERTDFWSSLIPVLRERVRLSNEVADAEERARQARANAETYRNSAISQVSDITGSGEGGIRQVWNTIGSESPKDILKHFGIDGTTEAGQRLTATLINLSKATEDATEAEQHKATLTDMLKGGSIGDIFSNAVSANGGGAMGVFSLINNNAQSMAKTVDKLGLTNTDFGEAVHGFADATGGFMAAVQSLASGDIFGAVNGIIDGFGGIMKIGTAIWGSTIDEDMAKKQEELRNATAMATMTAAILENTKALNNWLGDQGFAAFTQNLDIAAARYDAFVKRENGEEIEYRDKNAGAIEWLSGHHRYTTTARENLKIQTQHASYWRGENTENLEQWVREKMGKELFTANGDLDLQVYEAMKQQSWYGDIKDYSKQTLEDLAALQEEYNKIFQELKEYYSDLFSPLGDDLIEAVWDWYDNGVDALDSFHDKASDTFRKIANELMYEILQEQVFAKYRSEIESALNDYTRGTGNKEQKQKAFREALMQTAASLGKELATTIPLLEETIGILDKELGQYGFSFNSANAQTATSGAFEGMTSDQADALEGRFTAVQGYTARITEILEDWYKNGVLYRENYTPAGSTEQVAFSPVVNPSAQEVNVDFTSLQQELRDVKEVMERTNSNLIAFNTNYNTTQVNTADYLDTLVGRAASLPRQEELLRRMSKDVSEI